jgi:hypothetical protein
MFHSSREERPLTEGQGKEAWVLSCSSMEWSLLAGPQRVEESILLQIPQILFVLPNVCRFSWIRFLSGLFACRTISRALGEAFRFLREWVRELSHLLCWKVISLQLFLGGPKWHMALHCSPPVGFGKAQVCVFACKRRHFSGSYLHCTWLHKNAS